MHEGHEHHIARASNEGPGKILAMLTYMLEHNRHHADELHEIAHKLSHEGYSEASDMLHEAVGDFEAGNTKLDKALNLIKGE